MGFRFNFCLALARTDFASSRKSGRIVASISNTRIILLADDEPNDVFLMKRAFNRAGTGSLLQVVADGEEVIAYLNGESPWDDRSAFPLPSLILLDLKMPRRNGLEVLGWIRAQRPEIRRLPVIILTSSRQSADINSAYDLGANSYLVKPVNFEKLVDLVKALEQYWLALSQNPDINALQPQFVS